MLAKLHTKLGDFWWYSLMLFCACRIADVLNVFVGLWLVPKYVDPSELGAVLPLTQFANFLAIPIAAFANTFRNEVSRLSLNKEFGKLKTLMRGVFIASAIFIFFATVIAHFILPAFLNRIRIVEGSLAIIIIATSFVSAIAPIYSNALQALKKFREQSVLSIVGAPIRLITMLIAMPFRALTGYFVGQTSVPAFNIIASIFCLKKELSAPAEPYWDKNTVKKFSRIFFIFLISGLAGGFSLVTEATIIRQQLPDLDSAGYYMATRFSEIAGLLACTLTFTIFPFAAEKAEKGENLQPLIIKALIANAFFCLIAAIPFVIYGKEILSLLPHGEQYANYWWSIPWLIGLCFLSSIVSFYTTSEVSANRFDYLKWYLPLDLSYPVLLIIVSNYGHLNGIIPHSWTEFLNFNNINSLQNMLLWMTASTVIRSLGCLLAMKRKLR